MRISSALWALILPLITALPALAQEPEQNSWIQGRLSELDSILGGTVGFLASILLFDFGTGVPFIVGVLLVGGIYYTLFFGFFSIRAFGHSIDVVRGLYDDPDDPGEISHFKALTSALSATIGLGNIAGVAVAIGTGGPGALVWMIITAIFGMSSKLASCTLAIMYRDIHPDGRVTGGPMYYIEKGLELKGLKALGRGLAILFALLCIGGSLGGGNMFQSNQTLEALGTLSPFFKEYN
ncbi:MAG: alanine:cation symporter family protein, partial [Candidatus Latescibacterota bacterium]|nr:alanine:cation symporter family protein [Candidatus Latescibacterota bacterium]